MQPKILSDSLLAAALKLLESRPQDNAKITYDHRDLVTQSEGVAKEILDLFRSNGLTVGQELPAFKEVMEASAVRQRRTVSIGYPSASQREGRVVIYVLT